MIYVIANIKVYPGKLNDLLKAMESNLPTILNEKGCIDYKPLRDYQSNIPIQNFDNDMIIIFEKWETIDNLNSHLKSPHMISYREKVKDIVKNTTIKILHSA